MDDLLQKINNQSCDFLPIEPKSFILENKQLIEDNDNIKQQIKKLESNNPNTNTSQESQSEELSIKNYLEFLEKVKLFASLFKGRNDVYATRWESKQGKSGYSPACSNEWVLGICNKPQIKCSRCFSQAFYRLDENVIARHLMGDITVGIYPLNINDTCCLLAIDFDEEGWQKDITTFRSICIDYNIQISIERSRSGNGAHAWFFFENPVPASLARKFGTALLTHAMSKRHEITFKSYDRFFPSQDLLPKLGFGNMITLPFQKTARNQNNSVFIDEDFKEYTNQWNFLSNIKKMTLEQLQYFTSTICKGNELGFLRNDEQEGQKTLQLTRFELDQTDFSLKTEISKSNMIYINKNEISQKGLNHLKRFAAFQNPEFYKYQEARLPTFDKPRIISCFIETEEYLCLPRACEDDLKDLFKELDIKYKIVNKTNIGIPIDVEFKGILRDEQPKALKQLLKHDIGVLSGSTSFGKTVVAINLIAERKVNTLILVDKINLVTQWKNKLQEFLKINQVGLDKKIENNKKQKEVNLIGQLGGSKNKLNGIIDIAIIQSLYKKGDIKDCIKNYGMIIVDECHHIPAFSFEQVIKSANSKYVYGLTATPTRKDGHHPIIFMQCGDIRFRDNARKQAVKRPFDHFVIPRRTDFRRLADIKYTPISELYSELIHSEERNSMIIDDVVKCHQSGRNCIVLTERTEHVEYLTLRLQEKITDVISLAGRMGVKNTKEKFAKISALNPDQKITIVATGKFIGEGFDEPRLDTLFLAMPISWKGTLEQYAGRLHRLYSNKKDVIIYDYIDIHVKMLEKMYNNRLAGYASIGYKVKNKSLI